VTTLSISTPSLSLSVRLSVDGQWLACGSRDNSIYIYAVTESGHKFTRAAKCSVSQSAMY